MAQLYTIDASVFLNGFNSRESGHAASTDFLTRVRTEASPIFVPTLLFPEVAATVAHGRKDVELITPWHGKQAT